MLATLMASAVRRVLLRLIVMPDNFVATSDIQEGFVVPGGFCQDEICQAAMAKWLWPRSQLALIVLWPAAGARG